MRQALRRGRDRRGRGVRGRLLPSHLPAARTKSEQFDELVLDALDHLDDRWGEEITKLEFAVEDVPVVPPDDESGVPLSRLLPATTDSRGRPVPPRIVVYRRPVEARAHGPEDLADLVLEVVVHELAHHLGISPELVEPELGFDDDGEDPAPPQG